MKKITFLLFSILFISCINAQQINDPNAERRSAENFHGINVSNAFDVYINQGNEEGVAVSAADARIREKINVEVKEGILYIRFDSKGLSLGSRNKNLRAYISIKQFDKLTISGACDVYFTNTITTDKLVLNQSGASDLKGKVKIENLEARISGASDVTLTGETTQLSVIAEGASNFKGYDLATDICNAKAGGASDIKLTINRELSAQASGASDIRYKGNGVIKDIKVSGSGSVKKVRA